MFIVLNLFFCCWSSLAQDSIDQNNLNITTTTACINTSDCLAVDQASVCSINKFCVCDTDYHLELSIGRCARNICSFGYVWQDFEKDGKCAQICDENNNNNSTQCREIFGEAAECRHGRCLCLGQIDGKKCYKKTNETSLIYVVVFFVVFFVVLAIPSIALYFYLRWKWRKEAEAERRRIVLREWIREEPHLMITVEARSRFDYDEPRRQMLALQRRREAEAALQALEEPPPLYCELFPDRL